MKTMNKIGAVLGLAGVLALGGCETMNNPSSPGTTYPQSGSAGGNYSTYGVVQSIDLVRQENTGIGGSGIGVGTIAGAVVGGIVGNQVGSGRGNTAATVIGAAGGAYAGHEIEKRTNPGSDAYKITVRMENGSYQSFMQSANPDLRVGDRVRIDNGVVRRY